MLLIGPFLASICIFHYVLQECQADPQRIPHTVRAGATGERLRDHTLLPAALKNAAISAVVETEPVALSIPNLTDPEKVVLKLIVEGLNNDTIADTLSISPYTVKTHVRHIFPKIGVSDRTQAAVWAMG